MEYRSVTHFKWDLRREFLIKTRYHIIVWYVLGKQPSQSTFIAFYFYVDAHEMENGPQPLRIACSDERLDLADRRIQFSIDSNSIESSHS